MRIALAVWPIAWVAVCLAQPQNADLTLRIPPVRSALNFEGQAVEITAWGTVSAATSGAIRMGVTVDLGNFQDDLTPVLRARLNQAEKCGARMSVERAAIAPEAPGAVVTADVHYERFGCVKALGKEVVKKLVGGNAVVEVKLTPEVGKEGIALAAEVRKIDADGSLGEVLRSGAVGDSIREKIAASVQSALQKSANLKTALPAGMEDVAQIQSVQFADGGGGRLWLTIHGEVHLTAEQFRDVAKKLGR